MLLEHCQFDRPSRVAATSSVITLTSTLHCSNNNCNYNNNYESAKATRLIDRRRQPSRNLPLIVVVLSLIILIFDNCITTSFAAPQSCVLCGQKDLKADVKDPNASYEEFLFEHQVTRHDAINALRKLNDSFYEDSSADSGCKAVSCTKKVMNYCLGPQFINDHCWCELGHTHEGLPFIPHICYVGEKQYTATAGSCFFFEEVKDCCCSSALARQWRHISGAKAFLKPQLPQIILIFLTLASTTLINAL